MPLMGLYDTRTVDKDWWDLGFEACNEAPRSLR